MRNLHNSYFIKGDPLKVARLFDCDIIEADIIKGLKLSHSWRPFGMYCHGDLEKRYLEKFQLSKILYIEFKSGNRSMQEELFEALKRSNIKTVLLFAKDRNWFMKLFCKRERNMNEFYNKYKNTLRMSIFKMTDYRKTVEVVNIDLYKKSIWNF